MKTSPCFISFTVRCLEVSPDSLRTLIVVDNPFPFVTAYYLSPKVLSNSQISSVLTNKGRRKLFCRFDCGSFVPRPFGIT
jgi:hypothetical protein